MDNHRLNIVPLQHFEFISEMDFIFLRNNNQYVFTKKNKVLYFNYSTILSFPKGNKETISIVS